MNDFDPEASGDSEWEDRGELAWNEFDWERYLREQDGVIGRYLGLYESFKGSADRVDDVAERMGWDRPDAESREDEDEAPAETGPEEFAGTDEIYTLHKNPVFIATKAIYLGLRQRWELAAAGDGPIPRSLAIAFLDSLHRGEENAVQAVNALDFGDFAMAVSLFKRSLGSLNHSLSLLGEESAGNHPTVQALRMDALPMLFDLREIWLRVTNECRQELNRPIDEES
jgi:hypothetical protein